MRKTRTVKLNLLSLENRVTPSASIAFQSGNLTVTGDNTSNTLVVAENVTGSARVYAIPQYLSSGAAIEAFTSDFTSNSSAAGYRGTYALTGNITITGGNSQDFALVNLADGVSLPGGVTINTGNGADDIIVGDLDGPGVGTVPGRISLNGGLGADNLSIVGIDGQSMVTADGGGTGFRPGAGGEQEPGDVFRIFVSDIAANVQVTNSIAALDDTFGGSTIEGSFIVSDATANPEGGFAIGGVPYPAAYTKFGDPGYSGLLVIDAGSTVNGSVIYSGSTGADGVYVLGTVTGALTAPVNAGKNDLLIGGAATVSGGVNYIGTTGVDQVTLAAGSTLNGAVSLNMGDGANLYNLDSAFSVGGSFTLNAGSGNDVVGNVSGFIGGNQSYSLGNGNNSMTWQGTSGSSRFDFTSGGGSDALTINGFNAFALHVTLGAGDDTFTYGSDMNPVSVGSATIDFGAGNDTYNDNGNAVSWPQTLLNL